MMDMEVPLLTMHSSSRRKSKQIHSRLRILRPDSGMSSIYCTIASAWGEFVTLRPWEQYDVGHEQVSSYTFHGAANRRDPHLLRCISRVEAIIVNAHPKFSVRQLLLGGKKGSTCRSV
mmetsp:Transcript_1018/g.2166  ORF Transcript_1018/g.2166 Transcript_1018/m.2166 type:complete len:118 (+) Transcript_1018:1037-1390(+)